MIAEIKAALSAAKVTKELASALVDARDATKRNELVIEFQSSMLDLQAKMFAINSTYEGLLTVKKDIEAELMKLKDWEVEKEKYYLSRIRDSVFVYTLKESENSSSPNHWLCPNCFEERTKSIITKRSEHGNTYTCFKCKFNFDHGHIQINL